MDRLTGLRSPVPPSRAGAPGEHRWPSALAVVVAVALQLALPEQMTAGFRYLLPGLELALLAALLVANPFRCNRESGVLRLAGLTLTALVALSNGWSSVLLALRIVDGAMSSAGELLRAGAAIWATNVLAFALVYWELDQGGPAARASASGRRPDFLFAQMQVPRMADRDWEPEFVDYLYLSFTNATAFSPTDVLPLSHRAKVTMMLHAAVALVVVVLVVARAVGVLG